MPLDRPTADEIRRVLDHHAMSRDRGNDMVFLDRVATHLEAMLARELAVVDDANGDACASGASPPLTAAGQLLADERRRLQSLLAVEGDLDVLTHQLCDRIRKGELDWHDSALMAHLRATVAAKLAIDNPRYAKGS